MDSNSRDWQCSFGEIESLAYRVLVNEWSKQARDARGSRFLPYSNHKSRTKKFRALFLMTYFSIKGMDCVINKNDICNRNACIDHIKYGDSLAATF